MPYRVKLTNFEGPLDLLLFLIKKNEVDIYDIPIADITQQYLEYVAILQLLDLEGAGDFILLAATLIRIKAQMLLPKPPEESEE
jgi:segregation and condensation protein A